MDNFTIPGSQCEIEFCDPIYVDERSLLKQPLKVRRLNTGRGRIYFTNDNGNITFYLSVTTFIRRSLPMPKQLLDWMLRMGKEQAEAYSEERAHYGTFLHQEFARLFQYGEYDINSMDGQLVMYMEKHNLSAAFKQNLGELKKDLIALSSWAVEYQVKPLAMELVLTHPDGYAGAIDLICELTIKEDGLTDEVYKSGKNKGKKKPGKVERTITAVVDLKSGRHGFSEDYEIQLQSYKNMVEHHYPDVKIDKLYNLSPKAWRSAPSFNFTDQTGKVAAEKLTHMVAIAKLEEMSIDRTQFVTNGRIELNRKLSIEEAYKYVPLEKLIRENKI